MLKRHVLQQIANPAANPVIFAVAMKLETHREPRLVINPDANRGTIVASARTCRDIPQHSDGLRILTARQIDLARHYVKQPVAHEVKSITGLYRHCPFGVFGIIQYPQQRSRSFYQLGQRLGRSQKPVDPGSRKRQCAAAEIKLEPQRGSKRFMGKITQNMAIDPFQPGIKAHR